MAFSFGYVSNLQIFQILSLSHIDPLIIEDDDPALSQSVINFVTPGIQKVREDDVMESLSQTLLRFVTQAEKLRSILNFCRPLETSSYFVIRVFEFHFQNKLFRLFKATCSTTVHAPADTAFIQRNTDTLTLVMKVRRYIHSNGCLQQSVE